MENIQKKKREIFFHNLILLDLDKYIMEKKYGITLQKDMFTVPNKKGFEVISYFLFSKLNEVSGQHFKFKWPLLCKEDERTFQKSCSTYLSSIAQGSNIKFPRIVPSVLSSFGGNHFYSIYYAFSCYVLEEFLKKNNNIPLLARPVVNQENFKATNQVLHTSTIVSMERFKETQTVLHKSLVTMLECAKNLSSYLRKVKSSFISNKGLLQEKMNVASSFYSESIASESKSELQKITVTVVEYEKKVKHLWECFEKFIIKERELWNCVSSEIEGDDEQCILDGRKHKIALPTILLNECSIQLEKVKSESSKENEKLSIRQFVQLLIIFLEFYISRLKRVDICHLQKYCAIENVSSIKDDLKHIKSVNQKLILDSSRSIEMLKKNLLTEDLLKSSETWCKEFLSLPTSFRCGSDNLKERSSSDDKSLLSEFSASCPCSMVLPIETEGCSANGIKLIDENNQDSTGNINSNGMSFEIINLEESYCNLTAASHGLRTESQEICLSEQLLSTAGPSDLLEDSTMLLDSIDFDQNFKSQKFKMRDSWLKEESLNAMTLDDMEFFD